MTVHGVADTTISRGKVGWTSLCRLSESPNRLVVDAHALFSGGLEEQPAESGSRLWPIRTACSVLPNSVCDDSTAGQGDCEQLKHLHIGWKYAGYLEGSFSSLFSMGGAEIRTFVRVSFRKAVENKKS